MRKLILRWLFGTDDIRDYMELLRDDIHHHDDNIRHCEECIKLINDHRKSLERAKLTLDTARKLIQICENHGIDVDEEIKHIELSDVDVEGDVNEVVGG